ncbi:hypothetical protein RhiirA4_474502 [Rhizophagus irregularis]|uniref:Uncharacterized protein n=1 Tax=Rhizophagus irregularis TaxID=588596 RepID=A0A2I1H8I0_9GLOM|nr:hypothetical protein RhiirA4_474502 [Rhizophagus irregularis]
MDMIDEIIKADQGFIDILKNSIRELEEGDRRRKGVYLIIACVKGKIKISEKGIRTIDYLVSMILIEKSSEILLGIEEKVRRCLENFMKNLGNRKRIDEDYYLELLAIEKFIQEEDMKLDILGYSELKNIVKEKEKMEQFLLEVKKKNQENYIIEIIDEGLKSNEFNLYWKNEWFKRMANRNKFTFWQCSEEYTKERSYKIKNLLKELPTYEVLYKREERSYDRRNLYETIFEYEEMLISENKKNDLEKFDEISKKKEYKILIGVYGGSVMENIERIWIKRCDEKRNEDDNDKDINRKLRKIEKTNEKIINEKNTEKLIKLATRDSLIGDVTNNRSFKNTWGTKMKVYS